MTVGWYRGYRRSVPGGGLDGTVDGLNGRPLVDARRSAHPVGDETRWADPRCEAGRVSGPPTSPFLNRRE